MGPEGLCRASHGQAHEALDGICRLGGDGVWAEAGQTLAGEAGEGPRLHAPGPNS